MPDKQRVIEIVSAMPDAVNYQEIVQLLLFGSAINKLMPILSLGDVIQAK